MPSPTDLSNTIANFEIGGSVRIEHGDGVVEGTVRETQHALEPDREQNNHVVYIDTDDLGDDYTFARVDVWPKQDEIVEPVLKGISYKNNGKELRQWMGEVQDVEILDQDA